MSNVKEVLTSVQCFSLKGGVDKGYNHVINITDRHYKQRIQVEQTTNFKIDAIAFLESIGYNVISYAEFDSNTDIITANFPAQPHTHKPLRDAIKESKKRK